MHKGVLAVVVAVAAGGVVFASTSTTKKHSGQSAHVSPPATSVAVAPATTQIPQRSVSSDASEVEMLRVRNTAKDLWNSYANNDVNRAAPFCSAVLLSACREDFDNVIWGMLPRPYGAYAFKIESVALESASAKVHVVYTNSFNSTDMYYRVYHLSKVGGAWQVVHIDSV